MTTRTRTQIKAKTATAAKECSLVDRYDVLGMRAGKITGLSTTIHATFPQIEIHDCIIHRLSISSKYCPAKPEDPLIFTINSIEGFDCLLRKVSKAKFAFPTDDIMLKMLYLATMGSIKSGGRRQD